MAINPDTPTSVDLIECSEHCGICEIHSDVEHLRELEIWRSRHWLLRHHPHPSPLLGWCLLDARRHLAGASIFWAMKQMNGEQSFSKPPSSFKR